MFFFINIYISFLKKIKHKTHRPVYHLIQSRTSVEIILKNEKILKNCMENVYIVYIIIYVTQKQTKKCSNQSCGKYL